MVDNVLDGWPPDEAFLDECAPVEEDRWWPGDPFPAGAVAPEAPRLCELAPSGSAAWDLDWATLDPSRICDQTVLDGIVGLDKIVAWAQARQTRLLAEFLLRRGDTLAAAQEPRPSTGSRFAPDEVGVALRISRGAAMGRLAQAHHLVEQLPEVLDAWAAGRLDGSKVRIIADAVVCLAPDLATAVVTRVLPKAPQQSNGQLRAALARAIIAVDPHGANTRHHKTRRDRRVSVNAQPEGMASLWAYLSAPDARAAWEWLTRLARGLGADDPRTMDARRADLLVALCTGQITYTNPHTPDTSPGAGETVSTDAPGAAGTRAAADDAAEVRTGSDGPIAPVTPAHETTGPTAGKPTPRGRMHRDGTVEHLPTPDPHNGPVPDPHRPARERIDPVTPGKPLITVVIPYSTLTGADDQPCDLTGYGPIPADLARDIAADAVWKRLLYDPLSGTVLDFGRTTYHPPVGLADHVRARDLHCRGPRCPKPATTAELDHHIPYPDGPTAEPNLIAHCKKDHDLKHDGGWDVELQPDGSLKWTTPTGYTHISHPHDYRPDPIDLETGLPEPRPQPPPQPRPVEPDDDPPF